MDSMDSMDPPTTRAPLFQHRAGRGGGGGPLRRRAAQVPHGARAGGHGGTRAAGRRRGSWRCDGHACGQYALWCHVFWPAALGAIDSAQGATVGGILEERGSHLHRCREWAKCPDPDLHRTLDDRFWCLGHVHDAEFLRIGEANRTLLQRISILFVAMGGDSSKRHVPQS